MASPDGEMRKQKTAGPSPPANQQPMVTDTPGSVTGQYPAKSPSYLCKYHYDTVKCNNHVSKPGEVCSACIKAGRK